MLSIKKQLDKIKKSPGVYVFRDRKNKILYIGKAKNLRARVRSYFIGNDDNRPLAPRIAAETIKIETIATGSEVEAILLESRLIKKHRPKYNSRQKDDKGFIFIFINFSDPIPRVQFVRQKEVLEGRIKQRQKDKLFGPFPSAIEIRKLLNYFRQIIPYRDCADAKFKKYQKLNRGCQWSEINRCSAPCIGRASNKQYRQNIAKLSRLLSGEIESVKKDLIREMKKSSASKDYEQAAEVRDKISTLDHIKAISIISDHPHMDIYTFQVQGVMCTRITVEAVDISDISGKYASGSVVAAKFQIQNPKSQTNSKFKILNLKFNKSGYRRFKIRTKSEPDDVGMMREVIKRRFSHPEWKFPDLLIIDGGRGQLNAVESELKNDKKINLVAIVKGPKRKGEKLFFSRNFDSKLKSTLIKDKRMIKLMRDEAHRFAINYHKLLRKKGIVGR